MNMQLQKSYLKELEGLPDNLMLPLLYVSEQGVISPALAAQFKKTIYGIQYGVPDALLGVAGIAGEEGWARVRGRRGLGAAGIAGEGGRWEEIEVHDTCRMI